jgi:hypothetical protein
MPEMQNTFASVMETIAQQLDFLLLMGKIRISEMMEGADLAELVALEDAFLLVYIVSSPLLNNGK